MFVLLRAYELTPSKMSVLKRMGTTMERGGISILFTSVTDLVAFCVGSTSAFGSVSAFCVYCGVGIFLDFLFQVSFFLGFMVYDSRKQMYRQYQFSCTDCGSCCGGKSNSHKNNNNKRISTKNENINSSNSGNNTNIEDKTGLHPQAILKT